MADDMDRAQQLADEHLAHSLAATPAPAGDPVKGDCEACCDEDVWVLPCGGMPRCTPCRTKWEKRR